MQQPNERAAGPLRAGAGHCADARKGTQPVDLSRSIGKRAAPRSVRYRGWLRRAFGRRGGGAARRVRRAHREAQDGRRLPQLWLCALQGADGRRPTRPRSCAPAAVFGIVPIKPTIELHGRARPCAGGHRRHRPQRLGRTVHRAQRQGDHAPRPSLSTATARGCRRAPHQGAPFRDRHGLLAGSSRPFQVSTGVPYFTNETIFANREHSSSI